MQPVADHLAIRLKAAYFRLSIFGGFLQASQY